MGKNLRRCERKRARQIDRKRTGNCVSEINIVTRDASVGTRNFHDDRGEKRNLTVPVFSLMRANISSYAREETESVSFIVQPLAFNYRRGWVIFTAPPVFKIPVAKCIPVRETARFIILLINYRNCVSPYPFVSCTPLLYLPRDLASVSPSRISLKSSWDFCIGKLCDRSSMAEVRGGWFFAWIINWKFRIKFYRWSFPFRNVELDGISAWSQM